jgi:hypothetical protein
VPASRGGSSRRAPSDLSVSFPFSHLSVSVRYLAFISNSHIYL